MEVRSQDPSTIPSWVIVDNQIRRKDLASFPGDGGATSTSARASNGEDIRVSFILSALPGTSRLCLHFPEDRKMCSLDNVVAAHGEAVLFRLKIDYERLPSVDDIIDQHVSWLLWPDNATDYDYDMVLPLDNAIVDYNRLPPWDKAIDYFIYWAGPSGPELTLLPRWYMTEQEESSWLLSSNSTWTRLGTGHEDAPLEGKLIKLCSDRKANNATGIRNWEVKDTRARGGKAKFGDLRGWWETHVVLPYGSYLCWVDYYRGIIFCDVNHNSPDLQYLPLPLEHVPIGYPDPLHIASPGAYRAVCITKGWNDERGDDDEMEWQKGVTIEARDLWAMEGYDIQLPRITPLFPLVSMDDPSIICFVLFMGDGTKATVVALDTGKEKVLWYRDIRAIPSDEDLEMSSYNIFYSTPFFPCQISKYLQKVAPR
ncbi:hypothetical protein QOZ80_5BG0423740 [Eleusine coracana subsp. coracana]|nr:hypothetical protein QOZ80_5BG0423740 [Eleusine coracana subsp. coracana]